MALDTVYMEPETILAAKLETTTGAAIALTGTDATFVAYDAKITADDPSNERPNGTTGAAGALASVPAMPTGQATFGLDLMGDGAGGVPAWASIFLPPSEGILTTNTWAFSRTTKTLTLGFYEDGKLKQLCGAKGTFDLVFPAGGIPRINFTFMGKYFEAADTALLTPTQPTVLPPPVKGCTFTLGGYAAIWNQLQISLGNQTVYRPSGSDTGGLRAALNTTRASKFSFDPEETSTSARDWRGIRDAGTLETMSLIVGSANNRITIASTTAQMMQVPGDVRNGIRTRNVSGQFCLPGQFTLSID